MKKKIFLATVLKFLWWNLDVISYVFRMILFFVVAICYSIGIILAWICDWIQTKVHSIKPKKSIRVFEVTLTFGSRLFLYTSMSSKEVVNVMVRIRKPISFLFSLEALVLISGLQ